MRAGERVGTCRYAHGSMNAVAIFVDAGYLLASGGQLCLGITQRPRIECDYPGLIGALAEHLAGDGTLLRVYWYDAAEDGVPTADHNQIADLARVRLRLGRLVQGRQKGVDALIVRDLIRLARNRAMTMAWIVSGDEDLRPAIEDVQEMGIGVGIAVVGEGLPNRSLHLLREADETRVLTREALNPHFSRRDTPEPLRLPLAEGGESPETVGTEYAERWLEGATEDQLRELLEADPKIPGQLDAELLEEAERRMGVAALKSQSNRHRLRAAFWARIRRESAT